MSSFIISKQEYVKCAGLLFGYEEAKRDNHKWYLDHLYDWFVRCYELNVASVNEQYSDNAELDKREFREEFSKYCRIGNHWYLFKSRPDFLQSMVDFFRSASYQTENEEMSKEMHNIFYICLTHIMPYGHESWWGSIDC